MSDKAAIFRIYCESMQDIRRLKSGSFIGTKEQILQRFPNASGPYFHYTDAGTQIKEQGFDPRFDRSAGDGFYFMDDPNELPEIGKDCIEVYFTEKPTEVGELEDISFEPHEFGNELRERGIKCWTDGYQFGAVTPYVIAIVSDSTK